MKNNYKELKTFLILWSTQSLSQLGSAMTGFALTLWLYEKTGSALQTAVLSICSYTPYVLMSIFAGALSDRWDKKRTMLVCDTFAACCSVLVLILLKTGSLLPVHMYVLNAVSGLMNTVQQPASEVTMTLITPKEQYQRTSGLRSFSNSLVTILHPVIATSIYAAFGMDGVIGVDLATFAVAFAALAICVHIPSLETQRLGGKKETVLSSAKAGLSYLRQNGLILWLILFLAGVNFVASAFDAVLPPYVLSRENGGNAGTGLFLPEHNAVFYHSHRYFCWRIHGGQSLRAMDGANKSQWIAGRNVWSGKRLRRCSCYVYSGYCGHRRVPDIWKNSEQPGPYRISVPAQ